MFNKQTEKIVYVHHRLILKKSDLYMSVVGIFLSNLRFGYSNLNLQRICVRPDFSVIFAKWP